MNAKLIELRERAIKSLRCRLSELMQEKVVNKYQLSQNLGYSTNTISNWLAGTSAPRLSALVKLSQYFNCNVDFLLGYSDKK